jgi:hypothetical protein
MIDIVNKPKVITIVDSFISNESVLNKLHKCLDNLKKFDNTILLVSNTIPPTELIEKVDYFLYNQQNKLFIQDYDDVQFVDLWKGYDNITIHEITEELQKHGLSVMCNLFNTLDLAKSLGFTHFQRVEVDDLFSEDGYRFMNTIPNLCVENNKRGLFYLNEDDVSFHYMFSELDFFLNNVRRVNNEDDYRNFLREHGFGENFKPVEFFLHLNLKSSNLDEVLVRNGKEEMNVDFPNTVWNSETSQSTLQDYFNGCTTKIYNVKDNNRLAVLSFNYNNIEINRKIVVKLENEVHTITQKLEHKGSWVYHLFDKPIKSISVYDLETDEFLYEMENKNIHSFIEFK